MFPAWRSEASTPCLQPLPQYLGDGIANGGFGMVQHPMLRIPTRKGCKPVAGAMRRSESDAPCLESSYGQAMDDDEIAQRIEAFDEANGGSVGWYKDSGAYHLYLLENEAPIARLKPINTDDEVRIAYWSHRQKWEDIDDMGGCVLPLDQALSHIANNSIFWNWT
jgi:hypothetical protein